MEHADVGIVGGGIAGLALARALAGRRAGRVCLFEREPLFATHATGRNAAIFRELDDDEVGLALSRRTRTAFAELDTKAPVLRVTGGVYLATPDEAGRFAARLARHGIACETWQQQELVRRLPALAGTDAELALHVPDDGVLDIDALVDGLVRRARADGASLELGRGVGRIRSEGGRAVGVELEDGVFVACGAVVVAAGAWCGKLGADHGAPLPLRALRRHLAQLDPESPVAPDGPIVWRLGPGETYFRPESGGLLASPCDETEWPPELPPVAPEALEQLARRLAVTAPRLASARVRRAWACLRTFAPDRGFVVGPDPRVRGLFWVAGLGGRGMTCSLGLGELAAAIVSGEAHPLAARVAPGRLLAGER